MSSPVVTEEIKRQVGQHFVFGFHGFEVNNDVRTLILKYHVGNIILMKRNIQSPAQTRRLVSDLQRLAREDRQRLPLMIGIDQENGLVSAFSSPTAGTTFPGAMAIAATGSTELAEKVALASAEELRMVGINWVYSPVADVNTDPRNPVIGVRSFGDDPAKVAEYAVAVVRGHRAGGVASSAKHFPGHGDTHVDSHLALPRILKTKAHLLAHELVPFKVLVAAGVPSVMTGHMALPVVNGGDEPCSLSAGITRGMLRGEMGFGGVVVTDCLEMDAVADEGKEGCGVREGAVRALEAGADVVMICHTMGRQVGAVEGMYEALERGRIGVEALRESGVRIGEMKRVFAVGEEEQEEQDWDKRFTQLRERNEVISREAYLRSTTVVWNAGDVIPLKVDEVVLFTPAAESVNRAVDSDDGVLKDDNGIVRNTAAPYYLALAKSLERRVKVRHVVYAAGDVVSPEVFGGGQGVIFVMRNADLRSWQLEFLERLGESARAAALPLVLISSCGPYDLAPSAGKKYKDWTGYVATYEFTAQAFEAAVGVVLGEAEGQGMLPVVVDLI